MSKIAIQGNASGTGTLTIAAPNTNTDRTLTLPDATGTIITTAGGAAISGTTGAFTSTIGVGGATPAASGAGITFPATQSASSDANTLDDYEEGTWTPVFTTDGTAPTYTATSAQGAYTKIGNVVFVTFYVYSSGGATGGTGNVRISGLPFTASGSGGQLFSRILPNYLYWGAANKWSVDGRNGIGWNPNGSSTFLNLYAASTTYANGVFEVGGCGYYYVS